MGATKVLVSNVAFAPSFQHKHLFAERDLLIVLQEKKKTRQAIIQILYNYLERI